MKCELPFDASVLRIAYCVLHIACCVLRVACCVFWLSSKAEEVDVSKLPPAAKESVAFGKDVRPIFERSCFRCHSAERPKSGFRLDNREAALKGGENGIDIIPGNSAKSPLIHYVARIAPDIEMPPEGKGEPLTAEQVGILRRWIDDGAAWDVTNAGAGLSFSLTPEIRWISISGDKKKFREIEGIREGAGGGLEEFSAQRDLGSDTTLRIEGRALVPDEDFKIRLDLTKTDVGFIRGGFEQWRRY